MLIDRRNFSEHVPWIIVAVAGSLLAGAWYFLEASRSTDWPTGGSLVGIVLGIAGGGLIFFEFLLWPRKLFRTWRIGRTKTWMKAHIWLGLLTGPLILFHSGLRFGGTLSTVLSVLLIIVLLSGIWGLVLQNVLPRRMMDEVPSETIYSQIDRVVSQLTGEGERLILTTCGPAAGEAGKLKAHAAEHDFLTVGAVRNVGKVQGKVLVTQTRKPPVPDSEPLRVFFHDVVKPYLQGGAATRSQLRFPNRAESMFRDLKTKLNPGAFAAVDTLESMCTQRRQLDHQAGMHFWLHSWLSIHLPLSVALVALMFVHVFVALKFW